VRRRHVEHQTRGKLQRMEPKRWVNAVQRPWRSGERKTGNERIYDGTLDSKGEKVFKVVGWVESVQVENGQSEKKAF
jgi:hypothetical protein